MIGPFQRSGDTVEVHLEPGAIEALAQIPALLEHAGEAGGRLSYQAHPEDPTAEQQYRDLVGGSLDDLRQVDRDRFLVMLDQPSISIEDAEAWMRVMGEARIVLARALGIEDDGWEEDSDPSSSPEMALLGYLGYLQDSLVGELSEF